MLRFWRVTIGLAAILATLAIAGLLYRWIHHTGDPIFAPLLALLLGIGLIEGLFGGARQALYGGPFRAVARCAREVAGQPVMS